MAYTDKTITNPKVRQQIRFVKTAADTQGRMLQMEASFHPKSMEPPMHYHPHQEEFFTVKTGELNVRVDGQVRKLLQGENLHVPAGKPHSMWNASELHTVVDWKVQPALETEQFLETLVGLAADGKTNEKGVPQIWQMALTADRFSHVFRLANPPYAVQKTIFTLLKPFSLMLGYKPVYDRYIN